MSTILVRLYPPAIRQRWGADIEREVDAAGSRAWPDTVIGAVTLWLRPSDWPETTVGQTSRVVTTAIGVIATALALLLRATGSAPLAIDIHHLAASAWLAPIMLGAAAAAPFPSPPLGRLVTVTARTLLPPVLAVALLYLVARLGPPDLPHPLLLGYYWATLGFVGVNLCLLVARLGRISVMPGPRRLRLALLLLGAGLAFAAAQTSAAALRATLDTAPLLVACALALPAAAFLAAGVDLGSARHHPR